MRASLLVLVTFAVSACASGSAGTSSGTAAVTTARAPASSSTLITSDEISRGSYASALEIVENLRPSMLRPRSSTMSSGNTSSGISADVSSSVNVVVFLDEVRLGETSRLASIPGASVREIRYINARDATTRWGTGFSSGVIQVITKR